MAENTAKSLSDEEIVARIQTGNYEDLQTVLDRYLPAILFYARKYRKEKDLEDAIQEATIALYSAIRRYDPDKSSFRTFANLCIERSVLSGVRGSLRKGTVPEELLSSLDDGLEIPDGNDPQEILLQKERYRDLADQIRLELSGLEYAVLSCLLAGNSYREIAEKLSIPEKSVDNALARIRRKLKK